MELYFARIAYPITTLGPGRRLVLWTAGCSRRCRGCISPDILVAQDQHRISLETLLCRIAQIGDGLDGLTLTGGDPFDQPEPVAKLVWALRILFPLWNFMAYSGHTINELKRDKMKAETLSTIDLLIDGPYRQDLPTDHPLIGSANQTFRPLSEAGETLLRRIEASVNTTNHFELATDGDGEALLVGVGTTQTREDAHRHFNLNPFSKVV